MKVEVTPYNRMKRPHAYGSGGGVSTTNPYGAKVGIDILKKGGNAADAIVATSLVAAVTEPYHSGLGGGCFITYYDRASGQLHTYNGRGVSPAAAFRDMFLDADGNVDNEKHWYGGLSVCTPPYLMALEQLRQAHGTMTFAELAEPAIRLAREGYRVCARMAGLLHDGNSTYARAHFPEFNRYFTVDGRIPVYGDRIKNPDLADTLSSIAQKGIDWFYSGVVASDIADVVRKYGGMLTAEDIRKTRVDEMPCIHGTYRGYDIYTVYPPSSGGVHLLQLLNILENFDLQAMGFLSANYIHTLAEAMKLTYADRSIAIGDPNYVSIKLEKLTSKEYGQELAGKIREELAQNLAPNPAVAATELEREAASNTLNSSCIDRAGNAVAMTQTIGSMWGSGVVVPGRGFLLNNIMRDFSAKTNAKHFFGFSYSGQGNIVRPSAAPLSSMTPTLVFRDGELILACGGAGGPRIIIQALQMILNCVDFGMKIDMAVRVPYVCCLTHPQGLELEYGISPDTKKLLSARGHSLVECSENEVLMMFCNGVQRLDNQFYVSDSARCDGSGAVLTESGGTALFGFGFAD